MEAINMDTYLMLVNASIPFLIAGVGIYLKSYISTKAKNLATREDFEEVSRQLKINTIATEDIKHNMQRKHVAKSDGSALIIEKMAQIESHLRSWSILIYFREDELSPGEPIEELGRKDLRVAAGYVLDLNKTLSQYSIYFSNDLMLSIHVWSSDMYNLIFDYEAAYQASIKFHDGKTVRDRDKVKWISSLIENNIKPKNDALALKKRQINQKLMMN